MDFESLELCHIYFIVINILGFILSTIQIFKKKSKFVDNKIFLSFLILVALASGSGGILLALFVFMRKNKPIKEQKILFNIFVCCLFVIQIIVGLTYKGYMQSEVTFDFITFFKNNKFILYYLIIINVFSFFMFLADKLFAMEHSWRTKIFRLLFVCFIGGSVGGYIAMHIFRHKTNMNYFTIGLPMMFIMQVIVLFYIMNINILW